MEKIAVIGTHGTRKTTICHKLVVGLKEKGVNADYLGEIAREARNVGFELNEGTTRDAQLWILHTQVARELQFKLRKDVDVLICDRSIIDNYIYYVAQFCKNAQLDQFVNYWAGTYKHLFLVPRNCSDLSDDKVRSTNPDFQKRIDILLERELRKRGIDYYEFRGIEPALEIILRGRK